MEYQVRQIESAYYRVRQTVISDLHATIADSISNSHAILIQSNK